MQIIILLKHYPYPITTLHNPYKHTSEVMHIIVSDINPTLTLCYAKLFAANETTIPPMHNQN